MDDSAPAPFRMIFDEPQPEHAGLARHILPRYLEWYHTLRVNVGLRSSAAGLRERFAALPSPTLAGALCAEVSRSELLG